jgi:hypothetical protein
MYMGDELLLEIINGFLRDQNYTPLTIASHANELKEFFL